jgi:antitoxin (DNA-binding transcriptional repressor) of toxin-antitoxin stability system
LVAHLLWEQRVAGSNPATRTHKNHFMKMYQELEELQSFTVQEFQENFDNLMNRVENGESFIIRDGDNSAVIVPYNETIKYAIESNVDDEIIRLHTDHEEGS